MGRLWLVEPYRPHHIPKKIPRHRPLDGPWSLSLSTFEPPGQPQVLWKQLSWNLWSFDQKKHRFVPRKRSRWRGVEENLTKNNMRKEKHTKTHKSHKSLISEWVFSKKIGLKQQQKQHCPRVRCIVMCYILLCFLFLVNLSQPHQPHHVSPAPWGPRVGVFAILNLYVWLASWVGFFKVFIASQSVLANHNHIIYIYRWYLYIRCRISLLVFDAHFLLHQPLKKGP